MTSTPSDRSSELLTAEAAAERLLIAAGTLANWRVLGGGPPFVRVGRSIRYRVADLDAWLDARTARSTAEADTQRDGR